MVWFWRIIGLPIRVVIAILPLFVTVLSALVIPTNDRKRARAFRYWLDFIWGL